MAQGLRHLLRALLFASLIIGAFALPSAATAKHAPGDAVVDEPKAAAHADGKALGRAGDGDEDEDGDDEDEGDDEDHGGEGGKPSKPDKPAKPEKPETPEAPEHTESPAVAPAPEVVAEVSALASNPKVDDAVAMIAADLAATDPAQPVRVLLFGDRASDASGQVGADIRRELTGEVASVSVAVASLADLAAQSGVDYIALDVPVRPTAESDRPGANLALLDGAHHAWARGRDGRGVGIAVVDSGIGAADAFGGRLVRAPFGRSVGDSHGHGTFVAGVLASRTGEYSGVAPAATIYDVNVSQPDGVYSSDVIAGLEWVLANHRRLNIRVVNISLAETLPSSYRRNPLDATVERLWNRGVVVVVAAGNLGSGSAVYAPANDPYAITVGALDQGATLDRADDVEAAFSATGPTLDGFAKPELLAPGRRIVSLLPSGTTLGRDAPAQNLLGSGLAFMSGTSFAAPQVAGAAAVLLQQHPRWTPDEVKWVLMRTARPVRGSASGALDLRAATAFRGRPASANRALRLVSVLGGLGADGASYVGDTWSSNTWTSDTWSSNTWTSNTWTSNTWTSNTWTAATHNRWR